MRDDHAGFELLPAAALPRERLLDRLAGPAGGPLSLLVAPAGYGKTTLLAQYADRFPGRVVRWRPCRGTVEAGPLLAAIDRQLPGAAEPSALGSCVLAIERQPGPVALLLDDLHLVRGTAAEAAVEELALLAPPNLRILAACQRAPLLNLTRRELAGTRQLGPADLRLGAEEIAAVLGPAAPPQAGGLRELVELTQGWPAVVHLLRPALQRPGGAERLGRPDTVLGPITRGYLDREVLGGLPERLLRFLRQVAPLPELDPERCDALTGSRESAWLIDELTYEWALLAHDEERDRYRCAPVLRHHLLTSSQACALEGTAERPPVVAAQRSAPPARPIEPARPAVTLRCFGGFELTLDARTLEWSRVRPRARALLRILAVHPGRPVHREFLMEALWPERPLATAARSLQVAVSSLRTFLEPGVGRGGAGLLIRSGEAYLLRMPSPGDCDLLRFETAAADGLRARAAGRIGAAAQALREALDAYTGELLPEDGPAEWVVGLREHYRREAAEAALALAKLELGRHRPPAAAQAAARGLEIDPYRDESWLTLISAQQQSGDAAAAERSRTGHARMLASLGLSADPAAGRGLGDVTAV